MENKNEEKKVEAIVEDFKKVLLELLDEKWHPKRIEEIEVSITWGEKFTTEFRGMSNNIIYRRKGEEIEFENYTIEEKRSVLRPA
jgi:hypothetical protein